MDNKLKEYNMQRKKKDSELDRKEEDKKKEEKKLRIIKGLPKTTYYHKFGSSSTLTNAAKET
ncbi:12289_t:CDS:2, partial [Racocetra persica]